MARIYRPPKTAMQQAWGRTREWILEFEPEEPQLADPLMGWIGGDTTRRQVQLRFETREEAIAYAEKEGFAYEAETPPPRNFAPKSYADNFRYGRLQNWTH